MNEDQLAEEVLKEALAAGSKPSIENGWVKWKPSLPVSTLMKMTKIKGDALTVAVKKHLGQ